MILNGADQGKRPTLHIAWDEKTQTVALGFNPEEFRSWDFIIALFEMAKAGAQQQKAAQVVMQMQAEAQQQAAISKILKHPIQ